MHPHPNRRASPSGHEHLAAAVDPADESQVSQRCQQGIDLFNHGYYWEAHEVWESLWHAFGRRGTKARFIKGLIKLAAAGVKAREGSPTGVARHARRAAELLDGCMTDPQVRQHISLASELEHLAVQCQRLSLAPESAVDSTKCAVKRVIPFSLRPTISGIVISG